MPFEKVSGASFYDGVAWFTKTYWPSGLGPVYEVAYDSDGNATRTGRRGVMHYHTALLTQRKEGSATDAMPEMMISEEESSRLIDAILAGKTFNTVDDVKNYLETA